MATISVEIMKAMDEKEIQKTTKETQSNGNRSHGERVRPK